MHIFFATNNLGGGGTNVSRFIIHLKELNTENIGILLNYYYLNNDFKKSMAFDQDILRKILNYNHIREFLNYVQQVFVQKGRTSNHVTFRNFDKIASYILDSGSGNILRDFIKNDTFDQTALLQLTQLYHDFAEKLNFDFVIALDYALKYTHKQGESENENYQVRSRELVANEQENLKILHTTLQVIQENKYKHKILAPLHGIDFQSFEEYQKAILDLESELEVNFSGFALGGIADTKKLKNEFWNVPNKLKLDEKNIWLVSKLSQQTANLAKKRYLHVLGAGNIKAIPFLVKAGVTSSDCHSAWRRANDGDQTGKTISKILVPLFDENLHFIDNRSDVFDYVTLNKASNYYFPTCNGFTFQDIVELYQSKNQEDFYYAKILIFMHALYQYDRLIQFIQRNPESFIELLMKTPDKQFNEIYKKVYDLLLKD